MRGMTSALREDIGSELTCGKRRQENRIKVWKLQQKLIPRWEPPYKQEQQQPQEKERRINR